MTPRRWHRREVTAGEIVVAAKKSGARIVTSTYNEPLITSEWAAEVFRLAKAEGLLCSYVSNGNGTEDVLEYLRPFVSLYKVDLKGFRDRPTVTSAGRSSACSRRSARCTGWASGSRW